MGIGGCTGMHPGGQRSHARDHPHPHPAASYMHPSAVVQAPAEQSHRCTLSLLSKPPHCCPATPSLASDPHTLLPLRPCVSWTFFFACVTPWPGEGFPGRPRPPRSACCSGCACSHHHRPAGRSGSRAPTGPLHQPPLFQKWRVLLARNSVRRSPTSWRAGMLRGNATTRCPVRLPACPAPH